MRILLIEEHNYTMSLPDPPCVDGSVVTRAETAEATELLRRETYDLLVLDTRSPSQTEFKLLRRLRTSGNTTPLIALTDSKVANRVEALRLGADDAIADPVDPAEFLARVSAVIRRSHGFSQSLLRVGDLSLCLATHEVRVLGVPIKLTGKEYLILELLILRAGSIITKGKFLDHLYSGTEEPEPKVINVFICKIRQKLKLAGVINLISTAWGHGYIIREMALRRRSPEGIVQLPHAARIALPMNLGKTLGAN
jgi:two-component system cell cycle response regulator CtrA